MTLPSEIKLLGSNGVLIQSPEVMQGADMLAVILLATYNGERFLAEQLESILAQTYPHWRLLARDDGSSDGSAQILTDYQRRFPERIAWLGVNQHNLGASGAFSWLLDYVLRHESALDLGDYCIAFSDQDDIWFPHKLELSVSRLRAERARFGADAKLLVHSELSIADAAGRRSGERFSDFQGFSASKNTFVDLVIQNVVTGCSTLITPALGRAALPIPDAAAMHDWWLALAASAQGHIAFVDQPLLAYRQHDSNTLGARRGKFKGSLREKLARLMSERSNSDLAVTAKQARHLLWHSPWPLSWRERIACAATSLLAFRNLPLRLAALKTIKHLRDHAGR